MTHNQVQCPAIVAEASHMGIAGLLMAKTYLLLFVAMSLCGCVTEPVDISGFAREDDLEHCVGRKIIFTGECRHAKMDFIQNGNVYIEVRNPRGTFVLGTETTLARVLHKEAIYPIALVDTNTVPDQTPKLQIPTGARGTQYYRYYLE